MELTRTNEWDSMGRDPLREITSGRACGRPLIISLINYC